jgi:hypothetical protein
MPDYLDHPMFGIWPVENLQLQGSDSGYTGGTAVTLRTGFVCKECNQSVLAYQQPTKCTEHEE